jgi:hypothetical protein
VSELEKLMFLFPRKAGLTREEFFAHYLDVHAPLGLELTRTMVHYTVNLRDGEDRAPEGVDAITETWTNSVADFMNPDRSWASPADAQRLMNDHNSFIGDPYDVYAVVERVRKGPARAEPAGGRSSGSRLVVAIRGGTEIADRLAPIADRDDVTRYVHNTVASPLITHAYGPFGAFVEVNVVDGSSTPDEMERVVGGDGAVYRVSEYVKK